MGDLLEGYKDRRGKKEEKRGITGELGKRDIMVELAGFR